MASCDVVVCPASALGPDDVRAAYALLEECFEDMPSDPADATADALCGFYPISECWVLAAPQGHALAMAAVQATGLDRVPQLTVFNLCVHPAHRGRGHASALLHACVALGREHGSQLLVGSVACGRPGTDRLVAMYRHYGADTDAAASAASRRGVGSLRLTVSIDSIRPRAPRRGVCAAAPLYFLTLAAACAVAWRVRGCRSACS
eukprot:TRINITY_DN28393_c0_g1_i1.p1 TRINITY_DN28393_c0_g1~~TRINITY_DN28393_c0_g1_i1.p1  ORF type:complete len:222 (+),score=44.17 TRINITY_DN28393_c0_g1_i1:54-668(+)